MRLPQLAILPVLILFFAVAACPHKQDDNDGGDGGDGGVVEQVQTCTQNSECAEGLACVDSQCRACQVDRECEIRKTCAVETGLNGGRCQFRPGFGGACALNTECQLGQFCKQGLCVVREDVLPCTSSSGCPNNDPEHPQVCDMQNFVCVEDLGCNSAADCAADEVCTLDNVTQTLRCNAKCTPETVEEICGAASMLCSEDGRCVICVSDIDCQPGLSCSADSGTCVGGTTCLSNRDCASPQVCNQGTHQCTPRPASCSSNEDCWVETVCRVSTGQCVAALCQNDIFEPNNDTEHAGNMQPGSFPGLTLCNGDIDYYHLALRGGDRLLAIANVELLSQPYVHTWLYSPDSAVPLHVGGATVDYTFSVTGDYYLKVSTSETFVDYDLVLQVSASTPCHNDLYESNPDFSYATVLQGGDYGGLMICNGDLDWYVVEVPAGKGLLATVAYDRTAGRIGLRLVDAETHAVVVEADTGSGQESVDLPPAEGAAAGFPRNVYLEVFGAAGVQNPYSLSISFP